MSYEHQRCCAFLQLFSFFFFFFFGGVEGLIFPDILFTISVMAQVDAEYKLQDMKKAYKELELKAKAYKKRLDDLQTALIKHMEQYVFLWNS